MKQHNITLDEETTKILENQKRGFNLSKFVRDALREHLGLMGARSVYFNDEMETLLAAFKENDPEFNLTDFVKAAMKGDISRLTQEEIDVKIRKAEHEQAQIALELEHLKRIIPIAKKNEEALEEEKAKQLETSLEVIQRTKGTPKFEQYASIHSKLTGKTIPELLRLAEEQEEAKYINVYKVNDSSIDRLSEEEIHNLNKQEDNNGNTNENNRNTTDGYLEHNGNIS